MRMSGSEPDTTPARQRRAERRQATYDEMLSLAREALREGRPVSLRAIAADMGLTAPALYRYVDSHAALQEALSASIFDEVLAGMRAAADAWPQERHGHRLVRSLYAFREWALSRPEEFRLVFGRARSGEAVASFDDTVPDAIRFVWHLMSCLTGMYRDGKFAAATDEEIPEAAVAGLQRLAELCAASGHAIEAPLELWWRAASSWIMLCGVIRMEVDGMVSPAVIEDGAMFREALTACGRPGGVPPRRVHETVGEVLPG